MNHLEYALSLVLALVLLGSVLVWAHATHRDETARFSCRPGQSSPGFSMKGLHVYPRCPAGKRG